jgi:Zn-dependent alcohol dehydrogenase
LEALVTRTYPLEGVNEGYSDLKEGTNIRGVLVLDEALAGAPQVGRG